MGGGDEARARQYPSCRRCEALLDGSGWWRLDGTAQCTRDGHPRPDLANACICWQHERKAEVAGDLALTDGRMLVLDQEWSKDGWRRILVGARIVTNVTDLSRWTEGRRSH